MSNKQILMSPQQREKGLIELIEDSLKLGFSGDIIKEYQKQLREVQSKIKIEQDKKEQFKLNIIERGES